MQIWRVSKPARVGSQKWTPQQGKPEMELRGARNGACTRGEPEPKLSPASQNWTESPSGILKGENLPGTVEGITLIPCGLKIHNHTTSKHLI